MNRDLCVDDLLTALPCRLLNGAPPDGRPVRGGYACDLLSWVISRIKQDDVWLTILNSVNVVAVAVLSECACILLTEGTEMEPAVLDRAREKSVIVLSTDLPTFEAAARLAALTGLNPA